MILLKNNKRKPCMKQHALSLWLMLSTCQHFDISIFYFHRLFFFFHLLSFVCSCVLFSDFTCMHAANVILQKWWKWCYVSGIMKGSTWVPCVFHRYPYTKLHDKLMRPAHIPKSVNIHTKQLQSKKCIYTKPGISTEHDKGSPPHHHEIHNRRQSLYSIGWKK